MSYLLDKKNKRNNFIKITVLVVFLFIVIYFRSGIFRGLATVSQIVFRPMLMVGNGIGDKFKGISSYFDSKRTLLSQNEDLQSKLLELEGRVSNYNSLVADDAAIKEILSRKNEKTVMVLASILTKPNQSPYDTLVVDAGTNQNIVAGDLVFGNGNMPIGRVDTVYPDSSKIILFSSPGEQTEVLISGQNIFMQLIGRGGGNFEMTLPRDFNLPKGTEVVLPGITPYVVGTVETIISDPRDSFEKALLVSPVNMQELKFVEIVR